MTARSFNRWGTTVALEVQRNGQARSTVMVWTREERPVVLHVDKLDLAVERDRHRLVEKVPEGVRDEVGRLAAELAIEIAQASTAEPEAGDRGLPEDFIDPEPWPVPVSGSELLDELVGLAHRHLVLPDGGPEALALWTLFAWTHDAFEVSPLLFINAPTRACGKTKVLQLLHGTVPRPLSFADPTSAVLFRMIEKWAPTLLMDEADNFGLGDNGALRALLNSGYTRGQAMVPRCVGEGSDLEPRFFSSWTPKAIAGIGRIPDTTRSRCIPIKMRRKAREETVAPLRAAPHRERCRDLKCKAARWRDDHLEALRGVDPPMPQELDDRAADNWSALVAIADLAGGEWPARARRAALLLSGSIGEDEAQVEELLLRDIRDLFASRSADRLSTGDVLEELAKMEHRPWPEWSHGKPMTGRGLSKLLGKFGIRPGNHRIDGVPLKGYLLADFAEVFARYVADTTPNVADSANLSATPNSLPINVVADVADTAPPSASPPMCGLCEGPQVRFPNGVVLCPICDDEVAAA